MLCLSRSKNEEICIGDDIVIKIIDVRGDRVRVGVTAPKEIPVHRREILNEILRQKREGERV